MLMVAILVGVFGVAIIAGLASSEPPEPHPDRAPPEPGPTLAEQLDADPVGTIAKYGTAADLQAHGFGDEIRSLGYRD